MMCAVLLCCVADAGLLGQHGRHKGTVILVLAIVAQNALCASKLGLVIQTYVIAIISYTDPSTCDWQQLNASHLATGGRVLPPGAVHTYKHLHPPPPHTPTNKRLHAHLPTGGRVLPPGTVQTYRHLHPPPPTPTHHTHPHTHTHTLTNACMDIGLQMVGSCHQELSKPTNTCIPPPTHTHTHTHTHTYTHTHAYTHQHTHAHLPTGGRVLPPGAAQTQQCHLHWQRQSGRDPASRQGVQGGHGGCHDGWPTQWPT